MKALSVSAAVLGRFEASAVEGVGLGQGYIVFGDFVLAVTRPGGPRMPNGVEAAVSPPRGARARLGDGVLWIDGVAVEPGAVWDAVPEVRCVPPPLRGRRPDPESLAGRGPGLTPAGDDLLVGYAAGLTLFHDLRQEAAEIACRTRTRTTGLSATLLDHAARGELPEPAHVYLRTGDATVLDRFGHSSGRCLRLGLMVAAGR